MSKQRVVKDEIWDDDWFFDLNPNEKLVWLFLLTNGRANIAGVYKVNPRWVSMETGLGDDEISKIMSRFSKDGKILYENGWVALINFYKHLPYSNPNTMKGIRRLYEEMKDDTTALKGFERVWVTLLNLTLPIGSESLEDSREESKKKL